MKKKSHFKGGIGAWWKRLTKAARAFLVIAAVFLLVGVGSLGCVQSTGNVYELPAQQSGDEKTPQLILELSAPDGYTASNIKIMEIYLNVGTIYNDFGETAQIRVARGTSSSSAFSTYTTLTLANFYEDLDEDETASGTANALYNWIKVSECGTSWSSSGYTLSTYTHFCITAITCNVLINEIVFVGVDSSLDEEEQEEFVIPAAVSTASILYDSTGEISTTEAFEDAAAVIDSQKIPTIAQSTFFTYSEDELYTLMSVMEIRAGNSYYSYNTFHGDAIYGTLGMDLLALGTMIFGTSQFGLRIVPFLCMFGTLLIGFFLVRKMFKSDRAGLVFALLYMLCGVTLSFGGLGTPLMIGVFFFMVSLYTCYLFYARGIKKANFASASILLWSGLFGAASVLVNGAFIIPAAGVVALFIAGMVRQQKAKRVLLEAAVAEAEEEENLISSQNLQPEITEEGEEIPVPQPKKQRVVDLVNEYRFKNKIAPALFCSFLILGAVFLAMVSVIPAYSLLVKLYGNISASAENNVLYLLWKSFLGGFVGTNTLTFTRNVWWYVLFTGEGDWYAITATGLIPSAIAFAVGILGIAYAAARFVAIVRKKEKAKGDKGKLRSIVICAVGIVLCVVTGYFAKGAWAFAIPALCFAFALAAFMEADIAEHTKGGVKIFFRVVEIVILIALVAWFLAGAVFILSVPLPSWLLEKVLSFIL